MEEGFDGFVVEGVVGEDSSEGVILLNGPEEGVEDVLPHLVLLDGVQVVEHEGELSEGLVGGLDVLGELHRLDPSF